MLANSLRQFKGLIQQFCFHFGHCCDIRTDMEFRWSALSALVALRCFIPEHAQASEGVSGFAVQERVGL